MKTDSTNVNTWIPSLKYQERDRQVIDYQLYQDKATGLWLRGPQSEEALEGTHVICLGAAQTFGCFCPDPYPSLLQQKLKLPVLNYGYGGAGPAFFLKQTKLMEKVNDSSCVVIQVMSGRSECNSVFDSGGLELLTRRSDGHQMGAREAYQQLLLQNLVIGRRRLKQLIAETRQNWVDNFQKLIDRIKVPVVLIWFSTRRPEYREHYWTVGTLFGRFPHLVNSEMLEKIKGKADRFVLCVSKRGLPQPLINRFTGKSAKINPGRVRRDLGRLRWTHNFYYPSPEMHADAAAKLAPQCRQFL